MKFKDSDAGVATSYLIIFLQIPLQMSMEIEIHRSLNDKNVVGFHNFFEDKNFVYVILELCSRRVCQTFDDSTFAQ